MTRLYVRLLIAAGVVVSSAGLSLSAHGQSGFVETRLVSDLPGFAEYTDPGLRNPWAIALSGSSPFWISDNHTGLSTLYNTAGVPQSLVVSIPSPGGPGTPGAPTGLVFNNTSGFLVASNAPARFIFATEDGTILGWSSGANAVIKVDNSSSHAIYKGLALAQSGGSNYLYATDFHNAKVDVFDQNYQPVTLAGGFVDPDIPSGFAPFGIETIGGKLYVTYALRDADAEDDVAGPGNGFVNVFEPDGTLVKRFASRDSLNSPWGIALAPTYFGEFSGALLVGNFGDGHINAFDAGSGTFLGTVAGLDGQPFVELGLWGIKFGNGGNGGDVNTLYFTAGIPGQDAVEDHGLFGSLAPAASRLIALRNRGQIEDLNWAGGAGPFLVRKKASLADTQWMNLWSTPNRAVTLAHEGEAGFYQITSRATNTVWPFTAFLNGAAEIPAVDTPASAVATLALEGAQLTYHVTFSGLSAPATAAHIHGSASPTNSAGVMIPFTVPAATSGTITGSATLTPDQVAAIVGGQTYVNIHTANHSGGEIRGQVVPLHITLTLSGSAEVPPVNTSATGSGSLTLVGNQLNYYVSYSGLKGPATLSHIHGPADATNSASVLVPLANPTGTAGSISGAVSLDPSQLAYFLQGLTYINVHSTTNGSGEIRGQIYPIQLQATLSGATEEPAATASPGFATASMTLLNNHLNYTVTFTNLLSPATAAHIHGPSDASHSAGVIIPLSPPAASAGTISGTVQLDSGELTTIMSGLAYLNIHTANYPGGEIRGQIVPRN